MKRRTGIVLAGLAGSCVAPVAHAQGTELTIYGRAHVSIESLSSSGKGSTQALKNNTSRLGFRGKEALGDGLEAFFQIESGVALDDGTSTGSNVLGGRDSWVGLRNDYGAVKLGRFYHPYDDLHSISGNYFQLFTGTSNQLGAFESGVLAALIGTVPSVLVGGLGTIAVAALWMALFPELRRLGRFEE